MKRDNAQLFLDFIMHAFLFIAALIHLLIAFLRFYISAEALQPFDYISGICAIIVTVFISLYLLISRGLSGRIRIDYLFLCAIMLLYLISCSTLSKISQLNEFSKNKMQLYDTIILFFFLNSVGHYIARWKNPVFFRYFLNAVVSICSMLILYCLFNIFHGRSITTPNDRLISMVPYTSVGKAVHRLELAMNPNTTAQAVSIVVLIGITLFLWNKTIAGKALAVISLLICYACLVLTGSRTSVITTVSGCLLMVFFCIFYGIKNSASDKTARAFIISLVLFAVAIILKRSICSFAESVYSSQESAPTAEASPFQRQNTANHMLADETLGILTQQDSVIQNSAAITETISSLDTYRGISKGALLLASSFRDNTKGTIMLSKANLVPGPLSAADAPAAPSVLYTKLDFLLSGRLRVWGYAVKAIKASPQTLRHGVTPAHIFSAMNEAAGIKISLNSHNQFLEVALALGIPGLIVFILYIIYTTLNSIRMFRYARVKPLSVIAPIFFYVFLISNLTEASLMFHRLLPSYIFFFVCGWINERGILIRNHLLKKKTRIESAVKTHTFAARSN